MSKRKNIKNNRRKTKSSNKKKSEKPFALGFGFFLLLCFSWFQFADTKVLQESELITIKGKLSSKLKQKSHGGRIKTYYWVFSLEKQPIDFSIGGYAKMNFDPDLFRKAESYNSDITLKVIKKDYETLIKKSNRKSIGIKSLSSNSQKYFDLEDHNENKKSDHKFSYLFLISGIGFLLYGWNMKK